MVKSIPKKNQCPSYDIKVIAGDMNAKVGRETIYSPTIGWHSLHESTNDNGQRLINFATSRDLVIGGTLFHHKDIRKETWTSPDCNTIN